MQIKVKESTMVRPMRATPNPSLWISNLDTVLPDYCHTRSVYFYRYDGSIDFLNSTLLKVSLSRALVHFYPMAGRLNRHDDRIEIDCTGEGVLFVEAECNGNMDELGDFCPRHDLNLVPIVDYSRGISSFPLSLVQVTRFKCGGASLGIAHDHHVTDGISALHFYNTWSDIARECTDHIIPPFFDRRALLAHTPPQPKFTHVEYKTPPVMETPQHDDVTIIKKFKLSRDQINALKSKCKNHKFSTYEAIAGHAWRCVTMARNLPEDQETQLLISIDARSRVHPCLPRGYFGNVVFHAKPIVLAGELRSNAVEFAASIVQGAIGKMNADYLRSAIDYLELQNDMKSITRNLFAYKCPNLAIISWASLPLYEADFGWGKPIYVGPGAPSIEGRSTLLRSPNNDGSLFYMISLPQQQMDTFEKLFYDI